MIESPATGNQFRDALLTHRFLISAGAPGVYGQTGQFVELTRQLDALLTRLIPASKVEVMRFPPVIDRRTIEAAGYHRSFPHLLGTVHAFDVDGVGQDALARMVVDDTQWDRQQSPSDLAMTPAACYPVYPILSGVLPTPGRLVDVESWCFRHEPSADPARLRAFRMRELVCAGQPEAVVAWRDELIERGVALLRSLGLDPTVVPANDPFFGRGGRLMQASQREQGLKFELVVPVSSDSQGTAVMSCNYHREHFGDTFAIRTASREPAHTACVAFGVERLAVALVRAHGFDLRTWPASVRAGLSSMRPLSEP